MAALALVDNLIKIIDAVDDNKYDHDESTNEKIVIIGSGLIGVNFAVLFGRARYNVTLYDIKQNQLDAALNSLKSDKLPLMLKYNMLFGETVDRVYNRMSVTTNLKEALTDCIFIQEAVPENLQLKQKVFKQIDDTLALIKNGDKCIISSSTTSIRPSLLNKDMTHYKHNLIVSHPVNPPMAIPLIEICPSPSTLQSVIDKTKEIMTDIGLKACVMKKEAPGFVLNRLQYGLLQAAYQIVDEGIADVEDVDICMKYGLGTRWSFMGPFEVIHTNAPKGVNDYAKRYIDSAITPILADQGIKKNWNWKTWQKIHDDISKRIPVSSLPDRCKWRDWRLLNLAVHKQKMEQQNNAKK